MANDECSGNKKRLSSSPSSICEVSMLLVSNIIRLSCQSLFGAQSLPPNCYSNDQPPKQPQDHEKLIADQSHNRDRSRKIKIAQESADCVMATKPISYVVKPGHQVEVGRTLTRYETDNDDVDVHAGNYINQVRERINGSHHVNR